MRHKVRMHPKKCTPEELEKYRDKRLDKVRCRICEEIITEKHFKRHYQRYHMEGEQEKKKASKDVGTTKEHRAVVRKSKSDRD